MTTTTTTTNTNTNTNTKTTTTPTTTPTVTPTQTNERKSFQGDHHRHRYMNNYIGPPNNAHYSPHYGSPATNNNKNITTKRKPPPLTTSSNSNILTQLTPSPPPPQQQQQQRSSSPSPLNHHHPNKLRKTPSPSPTPSPTAIVKKIGSALTAPFRNVNSRRGSDASEINGFNLNSTTEHLPSMPSLALKPTTTDREQENRSLTDAQQIIHQTRSREPGSPQRVLRVVNRSESLSTRASTTPLSPDLDLDLISSAQTTQPLKINNPRHSFQSSNTNNTTTTKGGCSKCLALEHQLTKEIDRSTELERALDAQTLKLDQLRTWATAKVSSLDQTLQTQERLLQQVEKRMAEKQKPDIKSDYLIALQKDFVDLNARLALLESKQTEDEPDQLLEPTPSNHYISELRDQRSSRQKTRAYSTPPLATTTTTTATTTPFHPDTSIQKRSPWKPASPATMASKLLPPTTPIPTSPNSRSAPATPSSSRSPRPRYTSALAAKAPSPLGFSHRLTPDQFSRLSPTPGLPDSPRSPTKYSSPSHLDSFKTSSHYSSSNSQPTATTTTTAQNPTRTRHNYARPTLASVSRHSSPLNHSPTKLTPNHPRNTPVSSPYRPKSSATPFRKTAAVGDLIKMFDQPK